MVGLVGVGRIGFLRRKGEALIEISNEGRGEKAPGGESRVGLADASMRRKVRESFGEVAQDVGCCELETPYLLASFSIVLQGPALDLEP